MKLYDGLRKFRIKKDVVVYHPTVLVAPAGTILYGELPPTIGMNQIIFTKDEQIDDYIEEVN